MSRWTSENSNGAAPEGDIYYGSNDRIKFRSVHPPTTTHHFSDFAVGAHDRRAEMSPNSQSAMENVSSKMSEKSQYFQHGKQANAFTTQRNTNFFELATAEDCIDRGAEWPLVNMQSVRDTAVINDKNSYFNLAIPDAPAFLQITHFSLEGCTWKSVEDNINRLLGGQQSDKSILKSEYNSSEFLWHCQFIDMNPCSFQIRAYIESSGQNIIIEMQRHSGSAPKFSEIYHLLRSRLMENILQNIPQNMSPTSSSQHIQYGYQQFQSLVNVPMEENYEDDVEMF